MKVFLICDESGAKGYANLSEKYPGEAGVFAGYFVQDNNFGNIDQQLRLLSGKYFVNDKCHLRGLPNNKMEELRTDIFEFIRNNKITCIYEAIHVEGFKEEYLRIIQLKNKAKEAKKSNIKISNNLSPVLLHEELFQGLFSKSIAYFIDNFDKDKDILEILVDSVDFPILKKFKKKANEVTDFSPRTKKVTGWDTKDKKRVQGGIKTNTKFPDSYRIRDFEEIQYDINISPDYLTLAADIIANSINYIFKNRASDDIGKPLNNRSSLKDHELFNFFCNLIDDEKNEQAWMNDFMYMHPFERSRLKAKS